MRVWVGCRSTPITVSPSRHSGCRSPRPAGPPAARPRWAGRTARRSRTCRSPAGAAPPRPAGKNDPPRQRAGLTEPLAGTTSCCTTSYTRGRRASQGRIPVRAPTNSDDSDVPARRAAVLFAIVRARREAVPRRHARCRPSGHWRTSPASHRRERRSDRGAGNHRHRSSRTC